jgi:hypothetical protein
MAPAAKPSSTDSQVNLRLGTKNAIRLPSPVEIPANVARKKAVVTSPMPHLPAASPIKKISGKDLKYVEKR